VPSLVARVAYRDRTLAVLEPVPEELAECVDYCADIHGLERRSGEELRFEGVPREDVVDGGLLKRAVELLKCMDGCNDSGGAPVVLVEYMVYPSLEPFVVIGRLITGRGIARVYLAVSPLSFEEAVDSMYRDLGGGHG